MTIALPVVLAADAVNATPTMVDRQIIKDRRSETLLLKKLFFNDFHPFR
jgi:hypothetical protein